MEFVYKNVHGTCPNILIKIPGSGTFLKNKVYPLHFPNLVISPCTGSLVF
jgi:hypothetical protein